MYQPPRPAVEGPKTALVDDGCRRVTGRYAQPVNWRSRPWAACRGFSR